LSCADQGLEEDTEETDAAAAGGSIPVAKPIMGRAPQATANTDPLSGNTEGTTVIPAPPPVSVSEGMTCNYNGEAVSAEGTLTRKMYANANVGYGGSCASETQTGTCKSGTMIWDGSFSSTTCLGAHLS